MRNRRETWQVVVTPEGEHFPDHEASSLGRFRRVTSSTCGKAGNILTSKRTAVGYHVIGLHKNGKRHWFSVHRLVCATFHGLPGPGQLVVRHGDGSRDNNVADNLKWGTYLENEHDRERHGRTKGARGSKQHLAKLTEQDVLAIWGAITDRKETQYQIADRFGVSQATISHIKRGTNWGWLSP